MFDHAIRSAKATRASARLAAGAALSVVALLMLPACSTMRSAEMATGISMPGDLKLSGDQEVPPVTTQASGLGRIKVGDDGAVSGSVTTKGLTGTMAHIHNGAAGKNGPVIIPLTKSDDGNTWSVPAGAKLNPAQMTAFQAGDLYVNVHTEANKGGEIRAQMKP